MRIFGYADDGLDPSEVESSELAEITVVANATELRKIAKFLEAAADGMDRRGKAWEHEHLGDKCPEFRSSPHFVVFNPDAEL